jgi:predicted RND superfamily exporter protein
MLTWTPIVTNGGGLMDTVMDVRQVYSARERTVLWTTAALGFVALNGVFLYGTFVQPAMLEAAMANPLAMVFVLEALVMTGILAYLLRKWAVTRLPWGWFVLLAVIGSLVFALPIAILWKQRDCRAHL